MPVPGRPWRCPVTPADRSVYDEMGPEGYTIIQRGRVVISPEEALARESVGERLSTADRWHGLDTSLVRSGDRLEESKGQWIHMRRTEERP